MHEDGGGENEEKAREVGVERGPKHGHTNAHTAKGPRTKKRRKQRTHPTHPDEERGGAQQGNTHPVGEKGGVTHEQKRSARQEEWGGVSDKKTHECVSGACTGEPDDGTEPDTPAHHGPRTRTHTSQLETQDAYAYVTRGTCDVNETEKENASHTDMDLDTKHVEEKETHACRNFEATQSFCNAQHAHHTPELGTHSQKGKESESERDRGGARAHTNDAHNEGKSCSISVGENDGASGGAQQEPHRAHWGAQVPHEEKKKKTPPPPPPLPRNYIHNIHKQKQRKGFRSLYDEDIILKRQLSIQRAEDEQRYIMSDKEERTHVSHRLCKCSEVGVWWQRGRKEREAYLFDQKSMHPIDPTLHPITEGEEEDWLARSHIIIVVGDEAGSCKAQGEATSTGTTDKQDQQSKCMVLLAKEDEQKTQKHGYLDSGANSHMFKSKDIFETLEQPHTKIITACENDQKHQASVGETHTLTTPDGETLLKKGTQAVFCETLLENLISVGRLCEHGHCVVFDQLGYAIFKDNISVTGHRVHAQSRDPQTGLYPVNLTTGGTKRDCRADEVPTRGGTLGTLFEIDTQTYFTNITELRHALSHLSVWAEGVCKKKHNKESLSIEIDNVRNKKELAALYAIAMLARFYVKEGTTDIERWHNKLGHVGTKILAKCKIEGLKIPKTPFRCEHCIRGKMHSGDHSTKSTGKKTDLKPGEYIITDLQGPYIRTQNGERYSQIFIDIVSKRVWVVKLRKKKQSDEAIQAVLRDAKARSRNGIRILRTDGDGIFGRSKTFQELKARENFIHERPAPYDHQQSAVVDRECRTLLESINTALDQSGAPPSFWGDAAAHFIFTRNILPRIETEENGERVYKSPTEILEGRKIHFNLKHLAAFGTQVTCWIPPDRRQGKKTPGQARAFDAVILGYANDMQAYIVWDLKERKKREVSFFHCVVHEGFYPMRNKITWTEEEKDLPSSFYPTIEDILTPEEFRKYEFTEKEEKEMLKRYFPAEEKKAVGESKEEVEPHSDIPESKKEAEHSDIPPPEVKEEGGKKVPTVGDKPEGAVSKPEVHVTEKEEKKEIFKLPSLAETKHKHREFWKSLLEGIESGGLGGVHTKGSASAEIKSEKDKEKKSKEEDEGESESEKKSEESEKPKHLHNLRKRKRKAKTAMHVSLDAANPEPHPGPDEPVPKTLGEAQKGRYWQGFAHAIEAEITQLEKNKTWEYVDRRDLPRNTNILRAKFVFDIKRDARGEFLKYKARMVALGNTQIEGIDFFDTYASVMNTKSFRILLAIYNHNPDYSFEHWDVKQAFVNAPIEEEIYVHQIRGFERPGTEGKVLRLRKALYGTRQAAHAWQKFLSRILVGAGGRRNLKDECVYIFREGKGICIIGTHVDDLFVLCNTEGKQIKDRVLRALREKMEVDDKGEIKYALDTHIERDREQGTLRISQQAYIQSIIKEFNMQEAKGKETPAPTSEITEADLPKTPEEKARVGALPIRNAIGKLWWAALISRPDITCALHKCAAWQNKPSEKLWKHIMWIVKYLKQTITHAITYTRKESIDNMYVAYCDASFACENGSKSRYGYIYYVLGALVSWSSAHTTRVLTSSTEAECNAVVHTAKENTWVREFVAELGLFDFRGPTVIFQDNKGTIALMKGGGKHKRSKHFTIEFDALREYVRDKEIEIRYVQTEDMPADMFTKILPKNIFEKHRERMMRGQFEITM